MKARWAGWLLLAGLGLNAGLYVQVRAAEKPDTEEEKKKKEEEKFRKNALDVVQKDGSVKGEGVESFQGKFDYLMDPNDAAKPFPRNVGILTRDDGSTFKVMVADQGLQDSMKGQDKKKVNVMGKVIPHGDSASLIINEVIPVPGPVEVRRKRGGLP